MEWDISNIANGQTVCYDKEGVLWPITEQMILYCKKVGIPEITRDTAEEYLVRLYMVADLIGDSLRTPEGQPYRIDIEDVLRHLGLQTNAVPLTRPQFYRKLIRYIRKNASDTVEELKWAYQPGS
jgi:hypothetical protein